MDPARAGRGDARDVRRHRPAVGRCGPDPVAPLGSGQREVALADVSRLAADRRHDRDATPRRGRISIGSSARNRFPGVVTRIVKDRVAAVVEIQAGPHRLVSLMTAEAVDDLGPARRREATAVVKATNVVVELPGR